MARKKKYFIVAEGSDRAIMRTNKNQAINKKRAIEYFKGVPAHIFVAEKKLEDKPADEDG